LLAGLHYTTRNSAIADKPRTTKNTVTFKPGLGHWRSLEMSLFDTAHATSYWYSMLSLVSFLI